MKIRIAIALMLVGAYVGALRLTGVAQGGAQGTASRSRDWSQDMAMKITEPLATETRSHGVISIRGSVSRCLRGRPCHPFKIVV